MHGDIGTAIVHRNFKFLDEKTFAADFLQTLVENLVTASRNGYECDAAHLGHSAGIDPRDLRADNKDGYRWCFQTTSFGEGIGTPGAPNDPCYD